MTPRIISRHCVVLSVNFEADHIWEFDLTNPQPKRLPNQLWTWPHLEFDLTNPQPKRWPITLVYHKDSSSSCTLYITPIKINIRKMWLIALYYIICCIINMYLIQSNLRKILILCETYHTHRIWVFTCNNHVHNRRKYYNEWWMHSLSLEFHHSHCHTTKRVLEKYIWVVSCLWGN